LTAKTYVERFEDGPGGWLGWAGPLQPVRPDMDGSALVSRGPWGVDANHAPPGGGYLHLLFILHTFFPPEFPAVYGDVLATCGKNRFVEDGFSRDLRNARIHVRMRGEVDARGAQLVLLAQANTARDARGEADWDHPHVVNQVLAAQPLAITPQWSEQSITLVPNQAQWVQLGSRHDQVYSEGPIEDVLSDVNVDLICVFFPLDVQPLSPIDGDPHVLFAGRDYEIDRARLPKGYVMMDEVRIGRP